MKPTPFMLVFLTLLAACSPKSSTAPTVADTPTPQPLPATVAQPSPTDTAVPAPPTDVPLPMGDGIQWTKHPSNPVLDVGVEGAWDDTLVGEPRVLQTADGYHMVYVGFDGTKDGASFSPFYGYGLGVANSTDAVTWQRNGLNPILSLSGSEFGMMWHGGLVAGGEYKTYYTLGATVGGVVAMRIYMATSPDGMAWTPQPDPVLDLGPSGSYDDFDVFAPSVLVEDGTYKMWFTAIQAGGSMTIAYATSSDGVEWTKFEGNPVLAETGAWYPTVLNVNGTYMMWYTYPDSTDPDRSTIHLATSPDGMAWTPSPDNPVLSYGAEGAWDGQSVLEPSVLFDGRVFHMWFTGSSGPFIERIGYATSP